MEFASLVDWVATPRGAHSSTLAPRPQTAYLRLLNQEHDVPPHDQNPIITSSRRAPYGPGCAGSSFWAIFEQFRKTRLFPSLANSATRVAAPLKLVRGVGHKRTTGVFRNSRCGPTEPVPRPGHLMRPGSRLVGQVRFECLRGPPAACSPGAARPVGLPGIFASDPACVPGCTHQRGPFVARNRTSGSPDRPPDIGNSMPRSARADVTIRA